MAPARTLALQLACGIAAFVGIVALGIGVLYCGVWNTSGHSEFDPRRMSFYFLPTAAVGAIGLLAMRQKHWTAWWALTAGIAGFCFGFFVHFSGIMRKYGYWAARGLRERNPHASELLLSYAVATIATLAIAYVYTRKQNVTYHPNGKKSPTQRIRSSPMTKPPCNSSPELSHRERVRLALEHQETDRIPIAMVCAGINLPAREAFDAFLRREREISLDAYLDAILDIRPVAPPYRGPALPEGTDIWGVHRSSVSYGPASYSEIDHYPLADAESVADLDAHEWPTVDLLDFDALPEIVRRAQASGERCLMAGGGNPFETSWYMRGFERMFMDMIANPDLAHAILERVTDFFIARSRRILSAVPGEIDLLFTADDIGGQDGLLMSLDMWETFIKPHHRRLNDAIHELGARVIYHTDGAVMEAVPGLIDMGIDVQQALQFDAAGMDPALLKEGYGDRLCFEGGVSVQSTLPFGSPDAVRDEVRHLIATLGAGGGYILGPSHAIQAGTPPENVYAMFETALGLS